ncbi:MAG TPA: hypothetical protein VI756_07325 [Blastocatellia bacterium]
MSKEPSKSRFASADRLGIISMGLDFLYGMATALDLGATLLDDDDDSLTPAEKDGRAIASDWAVVGQDIRSAINKVVTQG